MCWRRRRTGSPTGSATISTRRCAWPPSEDAPAARRWCRVLGRRGLPSLAVGGRRPRRHPGRRRHARLPCRRSPSRSPDGWCPVDVACGVANRYGAVADHGGPGVHRRTDHRRGRRRPRTFRAPRPPTWGQLGHHCMVGPTDHSGGIAARARRGPSVRRRYWYVVAESAAIDGAPYAAGLLGEDVVVWRGPGRGAGRRARPLPAPRGAAVAGTVTTAVSSAATTAGRSGPKVAVCASRRRRNGADPPEEPPAHGPRRRALRPRVAVPRRSRRRDPRDRRRARRRTAGSTPASTCGGRRRHG